MKQTEVIQKRNVVTLDPPAMRATLALRHLKEARLGRTVSLKEAVKEAIMEKYDRDVKKESKEG